MRVSKEGDVLKFGVEVRWDPVLVVKSVERDRFTGKELPRYCEFPIKRVWVTEPKRDENGRFESAVVGDRKTGMGYLTITDEEHYRLIKAKIEDVQKKLAAGVLPSFP